MNIHYLLLYLSVYVIRCDTARILAVYPTPSISHQIVFRPLTLELLKRGHELVVITTDPIYPKGEAPANLTEIDIHYFYDLWNEEFVTAVTSGDKSNYREQYKLLYEVIVRSFEKGLATDDFKNILSAKTKKFDLLFLEAYLTVSLGFAHVLKAPVIHISSFGSVMNNMEIMGAPTHPIIHPSMTHQRVYNLTFWEKITEIYNHYRMRQTLEEIDVMGDDILKRGIGPGIPPISELKNNVDMLFLNVHPVWEINRPVPPNVVFMGGLHQKPEKDLPEDLKKYLDSSKNGVIYVSFGTNVDPSLFPPENLRILVNVFSKQPYDVLWKWSQGELPGKAANIKTFKWLPQADLLRHPKIKLFIMQGGLQSTDEAISAGVPLIGIPMLGDQWYNVQQHVYHRIGVHVDMSKITEESFSNAINEVINNESYRQNVLRLRDIIRDQPQTPLERAVWWTEYVIRHKGARHLRAPSANITWAQYLELELVAYVLASLLTFVSLVTFISIKIIRKLFNVQKVKTN